MRCRRCWTGCSPSTSWPRNYEGESDDRGMRVHRRRVRGARGRQDVDLRCRLRLERYRLRRDLHLGRLVLHAGRAPGALRALLRRLPAGEPLQRGRDAPDPRRVRGADRARQLLREDPAHPRRDPEPDPRPPPRRRPNSWPTPRPTPGSGARRSAATAPRSTSAASSGSRPGPSTPATRTTTGRTSCRPASRPTTTAATTRSWWAPTARSPRGRATTSSSCKRRRGGDARRPTCWRGSRAAPWPSSAARSGIPFSYRRVEPEELGEADELFASTTAGGVMPVVRLGDRPIGNGHAGLVTSRIQSPLLEQARRRLARHAGGGHPRRGLGGSDLIVSLRRRALA